MNPQVSVLASNYSSTTSTNPVMFAGGIAAFECLATNFNAGTVTLQKLGADGATWVAVGSSTTITAAAFVQGLNLPPGAYRLAFSAAPAGLYAQLSASLS
jgi:hypothetical protein